MRFAWAAISLPFILLALPSGGSVPASGIAFPQSKIPRVEMARHLLNRAAFGPRPGEVERLSENGQLERWLDSQLHPDTLFDDLVQQKLAVLPSLQLSTPELFAKYKRPKAFAKATQVNVNLDDDSFDKKTIRREHADELPGVIVRELAAQKIIRAVESPQELKEVLADFWFNHFNVNAHKGLMPWLLPDYERSAIRAHLFGKFRDLLMATAKHPAMLFYLDNWRSVRNGFEPRRRRKNDSAGPMGLNENYARELMELHTLGVDGGYTQNDVIQVARVLTGWSIDRPKQGGGFAYHAQAHDTSDVQALGRTFRGSDGAAEGEALIDFLSGHPSTARFISSKLCERFVAEPAPPACVARLSRRYRETDGDLREIYKTLFTSPEFWNEKSIDQKVKKPFDYVTSSLRALGAKIDLSRKRNYAQLIQAVMLLGEPLYRCVPPTGYKDDAATWVNTGSLVTRLRASMMLASGRWVGVDWDRERIFPENKSQEAEMDTVSRRLTGRPLAPSTQATMQRILNGAKDETALQDHELSRGNESELIALILGSPEFQRR